MALIPQELQLAAKWRSVQGKIMTCFNGVMHFFGHYKGL